LALALQIHLVRNIDLTVSVTPLFLICAVLVTHQIHLLPYFDKIIVMEAGQVKAFGEY
jgi:ABC-type lipoprotein export system ATPase subunit